MVSQRVVATDRATGDVPGTRQLAESPSIDFLFLPSSQSKGFLLSLLWHLESQWNNHLAEVVLSDTPNPFLGEEGLLGLKIMIASFCQPPILSLSLSLGHVPVTRLCCTHFSLASKPRAQCVAAGLSLSPAQWCAPNTQ